MACVECESEDGRCGEDRQRVTERRDPPALNQGATPASLAVRQELNDGLEQLEASDLELIRVLEDLVILLVEQEIIRYSDLPAAARRKLDQRALVRADLEGLADHPLDIPPEPSGS